MINMVMKIALHGMWLLIAILALLSKLPTFSMGGQSAYRRRGIAKSLVSAV